VLSSCSPAVTGSNLSFVSVLRAPRRLKQHNPHCVMYSELSWISYLQ